MKPRSRALTVALVAWLAAMGCSHHAGARPSRLGPPATPSPIGVEGTWASAAGKDASVYFILTNRGPTDDALTGASSPVATTAVLMRGSSTIRHLPLPAHSQISFDGRYQIALSGLRKPIEGGDEVRVTLTFANSGPVSFLAGVR